MMFSLFGHMEKNKSKSFSMNLAIIILKLHLRMSLIKNDISLIFDISFLELKVSLSGCHLTTDLHVKPKGISICTSKPYHIVFSQ